MSKNIFTFTFILKLIINKILFRTNEQTSIYTNVSYD